MYGNFKAKVRLDIFDRLKHVPDGGCYSQILPIEAFNLDLETGRVARLF